MLLDDNVVMTQHRGNVPTPATAATITVGTVATLPPGSQATVTNRGSATEAVLDFGIPQGVAGVDGAPGRDGKDGVNGVLDVLVATAASASYPAGSEKKIQLTTINSTSGSGFVLNNGEVVCQRAGFVLVTARATTTPPSGSTASQGYARLCLNTQAAGATSFSLTAVDGADAPGATNSIYNEVTRIMYVNAGLRFRLGMWPDVARTGTAIIQVVYLSVS